MAKKIVRLTEEDLQNLVMESMRQYIVENDMDEGWFDAFRGAGKKIGNDIRDKTNDITNNITDKAKNFGNKVVDKAKNFGDNVADKTRNFNKNARKYFQDVKQAGTNASNVADTKKAIETIQELIKKGILDSKQTNMVLGAMRKYINSIENNQM